MPSHAHTFCILILLPSLLLCVHSDLHTLAGFFSKYIQRASILDAPLHYSLSPEVVACLDLYSLLGVYSDVTSLMRHLRASHLICSQSIFSDKHSVVWPHGWTPCLSRITLWPPKVSLSPQGSFCLHASPLHFLISSYPLFKMEFKYHVINEASLNNPGG